MRIDGGQVVVITGASVETSTLRGPAVVSLFAEQVTLVRVQVEAPSTAGSSDAAAQVELPACSGSS